MPSAAEIIKGLTFKVADPAEIGAARALQREVFTKHYGQLPVDAADLRAHHFVIYDSERNLVGTFRIVGPEQRPFDLEKTVDLSSVLKPRRAPGLIGRLCIRRDLPTPQEYMMIPAGVLKLAYDFSRKHGITDLLTYTYPRLLTFYRRAFFREFDTVDHEVWGLMHVMHLDLIELERDQSGADTPLAHFLFRSKLPNFQV